MRLSFTRPIYQLIIKAGYSAGGCTGKKPKAGNIYLDRYGYGNSLGVRSPETEKILTSHLFPVQQSLLSFQFADFGQVLTDFEASPIVSTGIPHRKVADVDKFATQFDPEGRRIPGA